MMRTYRSKRLDYFLSSLEVQPEDTSVCLEWPFSLTHHGYGCINYRCNPDSPSKVVMTHRLAYTLKVGPIPPGQWCICHHCDNPKCYRPSHLFLGTHTDNHQDCMRKGRRGKQPQDGEHNGNNKLTEEQVREMNALYHSGLTKREIALRFKIAPAQVGHISRKKAWTHLTDLSWERPAIRKTWKLSGPRKTVTESQVREIRLLFKSGVRNKDIAERFAISPQQVSGILARRIWAHLP